MRYIITVFLFMGISLCLSCSDNQAARLRYQAEKDFHQAEKRLRDYHTRPGKTEPEIVREIATLYRDLMEFTFLSLDSVEKAGYPQMHRELTFLAFQSSSRLSQLYYSTGQFDSSIAITNRLLSVTKQEPAQFRRTQLNLGRALQASGQWTQAKQVYDELLTNINPPVGENSEVLNDIFGLPTHIFNVTSYVYGAANAQEEFQQAVQYYQTLAKDYPKTNLSTSAHANLYSLYERTGKWQEALDELNKLHDYESENRTKLLIRMANIYMQGLNNPDEALKIYNKILQTEQDSLIYPAVKFKICQLKLRQAKPSEARSLLIKLKDNYPVFYSSTPSPQLAMAQAFEYDGNWNRAEIEYKLLIEKYPGSEQAMATYLHIADYLAKDGRDGESGYWLDQAAIFYDQLIKRKAGTPTEAIAMIFKADLLIRNAQPAEALDLLVELYNKFPGTGTGQRAILQAVRICREELGDDVQAEALLKTLKASMTSTDDGYEI